MKAVLFGIAIAVAGAGCAKPVNQAVYEMPDKARRGECHAACAALDMELAAMVLMMNSAGCVCQVPAVQGPPGVSSGASAVSGGATIIAAQIAAAQAAEAQRRQQQAYKPAK